MKLLVRLNLAFVAVACEAERREFSHAARLLLHARG
jgi:hypothetical protein